MKECLRGDTADTFDDRKGSSVSKRRVKILWDRETRLDKDGYYVMPIPFKKTALTFPKSKPQALRRLDSL